MNTTRDESFVPLTSAATPSKEERPDFRVTVRSQTDDAPPFQSLGQAAGSFSPAQSSNLEPRLTLQREGDRISSIRIQCTCGQTIELACVYELPPPPAPVPEPEIAPATGPAQRSASPAELRAPTPPVSPPPPATVLPPAAAAPRRKPKAVSKHKHGRVPLPATPASRPKRKAVFRRKPARAKPRRKAGRSRSRRQP
jgi:hypothetical protein